MTITEPETVQTPPTLKSWGRRVCPECGETFTATHHAQGFCTTDHQQAFHNLMAKRGKVMTSLVLSWRRGRGSSDVAKYAFEQMSALADIYNAEDVAAGRRPGLVVERKRATMWQAVDVLL